MNYGRAIRIVRAARGLSQKDLAVSAELTPSYVSLIEAGKRSPTDETIDALVASLRIPKFLFLFLASDPIDRRGLQPEQGEEFGRVLLEILMRAEDTTGADVSG